MHIHIVLFYAVMCHPLNLVNGEATYNTTVLSEFGRRGYSVGTMATFSCDGEESGSVICQSSGNWSQPGPTCIASNENEKLYLVTRRVT